MSRPCNRDVAGFTLLECEVALIVLALVLLGLLRATADHERLLSTLDDLPGVASVRWVRPAADPLARALGRPAELLESEPAWSAPQLVHDLLGDAAAPGERFEVLEVGRDLPSRRSWALVRVNHPGPPDDDEPDADARDTGSSDAADDAPGKSGDAPGKSKGRGSR